VLNIIDVLSLGDIFFQMKMFKVFEKFLMRENTKFVYLLKVQVVILFVKLEIHYLWNLLVFSCFQKYLPKTVLRLWLCRGKAKHFFL
jgi:hypothetical protein